MSDVMKELAKPFPAQFVHTNPSGGGSYVKHHVIEQRMIQVLGAPPSFEKVEIVYGDVPGYKTAKGKEFPDLKQVIVAVVCRMTVKIGGGWSGSEAFTSLGEPQEVVVEEAGDCEQPHNWNTDGQRLKDAMSDAYKRCAMRLGCGLHLWSQDEYFLYDKLSGEARPSQTPSKSGPEVSPDPSKAKTSSEVPVATTSTREEETPIPASAPAPEQARTSPSSSEGVETEAGKPRGGEVTNEPFPVEASSEGSTYELIARAMGDKKLAQRICNSANTLALKADCLPKGGVKRENIMELPDEILEAVVEKLKLGATV